MKYRMKLTAAIMSAVIGISAVSVPCVNAQGRVSAPEISAPVVGALYEGETFSKTLTPPTKTVYNQGDKFSFADFEIGTIKMTQVVENGEVKEKFDRIAYWVNWVDPDCYFFVNEKGEKFDSRKFGEIPVGKYSVEFAKTIEFSETENHKKTYIIGGVDYSYEIEVKASATSTKPATTTIATTTTAELRTTTSNTKASTTTPPETTSEFQTTTTFSTEDHPFISTFNTQLKVGEQTSMLIYELTKGFSVEIDDPKIVSFEKKSDSHGIFTGLKDGVTKVHITTNNDKKVHTYTMRVGTAVTTITSSDITTITTTTGFNSSTTTTYPEEMHFEPHPTPLIIDRDVNVGEYIIVTVMETSYSDFGYKIEDESIIRLEHDEEFAKGRIYGLKEGKTKIHIYPVETGKDFVFEITVLPPIEKFVRGDANCDDIVTLADAVLVMQSIANPQKFGLKGTDEHHLTKKGASNADISGIDDGITNADALVIQKYMLGYIKDLEKYGWWLED